MKRLMSHALALALCLPVVALAADPPPPAAPAAVKSANIFEVKPDASEAPNYAAQTNGERAQVQPGNNAPMWRQVGSGVTGLQQPAGHAGARGGQPHSALCAVPRFAPDQRR